jgi:hypothetical protein
MDEARQKGQEEGYHLRYAWKLSSRKTPQEQICALSSGYSCGMYYVIILAVFSPWLMFGIGAGWL